MKKDIKGKLNLHRFFSAAAVMAMTAGVLFYANISEAADLAKTRGRVNVDLEDFVLVESTESDTGDFGLKSQNDSNDRYLLHYENSFTDRNNIGCTYRSSEKYDMTDVTALEMYAYSQQESNDKIMFYVDSGSRTYYHRKDRDDIDSSLVTGDGAVLNMSYFCYSSYGQTPQDYKFGISQRYGSEYVYLGLSHEWQWHNAKLYLDNKTIVSNTEGCVNLYLKKHNITLLEPDKFTFVQADGSEKVVEAFTNLSLGLEDGKYEAGETGAVYRDESITLNYTLMDAGVCNLVGYNFYSDAEKENLLYTMSVEGKGNQSTFIFNTALIKKLEEKTGAYKLGDIYLEPVFTSEEVTFDFNNIVPENDSLEVVQSDTNAYVLREKESQTVIGTFTKNAAKIGDIFTIDYEANPDYDGAYAFRYYEIRECESANQVSTTDWEVAHYSTDPDVHDVEKKYTKTYFWIRAHIGKAMKVELEDIETDFSNKEIVIGEAKVSWQGEEVKVDEEDIVYLLHRCKLQ